MPPPALDCAESQTAAAPVPLPNLPADSPLLMPTQDLSAAPARTKDAANPALLARRLVVIGGAAIISVIATYQMYNVLNGRGLTPLGLIITALFTTLFAWIALAFTSAIAGVVATLQSPLALATPNGPAPTLTQRVALLMPTYNEDPTRVLAGLEAMIADLEATGQRHAFDVFILSDTTRPDIWIAEQAAFLDLRSRIPNGLYYRRRSRNTGRKAGNVADWLTRFGAAYPTMVTLDADSIMAADTLIRIAAAMETNPHIGLIQTLPVIVNGTSLFARLQQFAGRVYGPLIAQGITWWYGPHGNYWGHNAILRTAAFAAAAGLPTLPGPAPWGGHILSHDFIEAALMRRAGWPIHMVPALSGSYEESPPSLTDIAIRDRRWAQGNLQHTRVIGARGLHWVSRLHLAMGIGAYITSPIWLIFILLGILISLQSRFVRPEYFGPGRSLFPNWPIIDPVLAQAVFAATMAILLAPKLMAYALLLANGPLRRGCGGAIRAGISVLLETIIGALIAPVAMLLQTSAVAGILLGRDSGWNAQNRTGTRLGLATVARGYWRYTAFGAALALTAFIISPALAAWMSPVLAGLLLAIPLVAWTAGSNTRWRKLGLLRIPEETSPPEILTRAAALRASLPEAEPPPAIPNLLANPALMAAHRAWLPPPRPRGAGPLDPNLVFGLAKLHDTDTLATALATLTPAETAAILSDATALDRLTQLG